MSRDTKDPGALSAAERRALDHIASEDNVENLRQVWENARGKSKLVEKAAFRRLIHLSASHHPGTSEHDCWLMVHTIEQLRRGSGRTWRMNRMRPKIEREGEVAALEYCALHETDGFSEVLDYGLPEMTAEAIVLRHQARFTSKAVTAAGDRLAKVGISVGEDGELA